MAEWIGLKKAEHRKKKEPRWKRRIEGDIKRLRQEVNFLEKEVNGELGLKKKRKLSELNERYRMKRKGWKTVIEELKQKILEKNAKVRRYQQRIEQFRQNRIFDFDQKKMCAESNGEKVTKQCRKMPNWKALGKDGVQGYWIKNLSNLYERITVQANKILMGDDSLPAWMRHGRTVLCQKDLRKGNVVENYCPITCLPVIWELLIGVIAEEMYDYLEQEKFLPEEQK